MRQVGNLITTHDRIIGGMPLASIAMSTTIAPRVQIFTRLACMAHRPEYMSDDAKTAPTMVEAGWGHAFTPQRGPHGGFISVLLPQLQQHQQQHTPSNATKIPSPSEQCQSDPVVQAAVAELIARAHIRTSLDTC